jgi:antitoxin component YwqK of YwqJK toxin-antitoxin module
MVVATTLTVAGWSVGGEGVTAVVFREPTLARRPKPEVPDALPDSVEGNLVSPDVPPVPPAPSPLGSAADPDAPAPLAAPESANAPASLPARASEFVTERYSNGKLKSERQVALDDQQNYVNHGSYRAYDVQGNVTRAGQYRDGKQHGRWMWRFEAGEGGLFSGECENQYSGPFVSEATFADGQLHGTWTIVSVKTRQKIIEWEFEQGQRHGRATWWYPNGQRCREMTFKKGLPEGDYVRWSPDGRVLTRSAFIEGRELLKQAEWYSSGQKRAEGPMLLPRGPNFEFDWWNGTVQTTPPATDQPAAKHGLWVEWHPGGQKEAEGHFEHDRPVGKFVWWYENGQRKAEGHYTAGAKDGDWTYWHANGMKESQVAYRAGEPMGRWLRWQTDGKLTEIRDYSSRDVLQPAVPQSPAAPPRPGSPSVRMAGPDLGKAAESVGSKPQLDTPRR